MIVGHVCEIDYVLVEIENLLKGSPFPVLLRTVTIRNPIARTVIYFPKALHRLFLNPGPAQ